MKNIYKYLEEYGNTSFKDKEINIIDYSIFSAITYMDFIGLIDHENITISSAIKRFLAKRNKKDYTKEGIIQKDVYELAERIIRYKRYKDLMISDYIYKLSHNEQFCAFTINMGWGKKIICFEGTDNNLAAWEEDMNFCSVELTLADKDAVKYLNRAIKLLDREIIVLGHSKGGRLAVTSSMYQSRFKQDKIKTIYSFDGPGILKEHLDDKNYLCIKNKIKHIIPNYSLVGVLLYLDVKDIVVKSTYKDVRAHSLFSWEIEDSNFIEAELSTLSKKWESSIERWLDLYSYDERRIFTRQIFNTFRDLGYSTLTEVFSVKNLLNIVLNSRKYDDDTKRVLVDFFAFNLKNVIL